jgi:hypothetical protein
MPSAKDVLPEAEDVADAAAEAMAASAATQAAMFERALQLPQELTRFYAQRMGRDLETMQALGRCKTPADVMNVWTDAAQAAADDYREGVVRMMDLVTPAANGHGSNGARPRKK